MVTAAKSWQGRPVLVSGATGLLGGWIVGELLDRGAEVVALVRDQVPNTYFQQQGYDKRSVVIQGDLCHLLLLERVLVDYEITAVFHLAAQSQVGAARRQPYHAFESNVRGTYTLLDAIRRADPGMTVLVASSDKAYGEQPVLPYTEEMPLLGRNPYDASKAAADLIARAYAHSFGMNVVVTRCGNLFGGGDLNWQRLVPGAIRAALRGERPVIRSDGSPVRDYLYVSDAAAAYVDLATRAEELRGQAFNFSLERPLNVLEMVELVGATLGKRLDPLIRNDALGEIPSQYLSAARARTVLGWTPRVGLEEGLRRTAEWYQAHLRSAGA